TASVTTTRANSFVLGVGDDPSAGVSRTLGANQTELAESLNNNCISGFCSPDSYTLWAQRVSNSIATSGSLVTINDTAPTDDAYNLSIVEVRPPDTVVPSITSLSPSTGPVGTSVTITGSHFGTTPGSNT